jgi:hypothetical protein
MPLVDSEPFISSFNPGPILIVYIAEYSTSKYNIASEIRLKRQLFLVDSVEKPGVPRA